MCQNVCSVSIVHPLHVLYRGLPVMVITFILNMASSSYIVHRLDKYLNRDLADYNPKYYKYLKVINR